MRNLTIIESPLSDKNGRSMDENLLYLRQCLRDSWNRGELPFASHAFFPFFLNEHNPAERLAGIQAGYQFWNMLPCDEYGNPLGTGRMPTIVFYTDHGMSDGMKMALERARLEIGGVGISMRTLNPAPTTADADQPTTTSQGSPK